MSERKLTVAPSNAPKKIASIQFGLLDSDEIRRSAEIRVTTRDIYHMPARTPALNGCLDQRLGISDKATACKTCGKKLSDCAGHFGYIELELPVFHAGYFRHVLNVLQCICKRCSRVLLNAEDRANFLRKAKATNLDALARAAMFKRISDLCKRASTCPHCAFANGVVKKLTSGFLKIVHEKYRARNAQEHTDADLMIMHEVMQQYPELRSVVQRPTENLTPLRAYELLSQIHEEDLHLLWMNGRQGRPESMIIWTIPVPPVPIRPSVPQDFGGGSTEDDLTVKLQEIIEMNSALRMALSRGATMKMVAEDWEFLQIHAALYINGESPGLPRQLQAERSIRGLCQRLKGKQGRFRGNLSGKRVDFSGRTVISPDPNLRIDQVGVPVLVAKVMTYPERVNEYNLQRMRQLVINGPDIHPGANIVRSGNFVSALQYADRERSAFALKIGDIVERHMDDNDIVLFNRQPSLHKMSIMAHRVKVVPWRTFRFNECACTPYNADFDGDEMNLHLPQTEEAKAEASELMNITNNLVSPRNGEPLVAATQDFLTGAYLLTAKDVFLTKSTFCRLVAYLSDANEHVDIPPPAIIKPRQLWTGKQVISLLVRPNKASQCFVNVESEERFYTENKHFCWQDGFVCFRQGELISGNLGKKTLGGDSKMGLFYALIRDFGAPEATRCMSRLAKLCARFLGERGFSIGIDDVTPSKKMLAIKQQILTSGQAQAVEQIEAYNSGKIHLKPGCDALQSLESEVNGILGKIRENCGKEANNALNHRNAPLCMAQCGSKGSLLNISQMIACLGQQSVGGQRIQNGFVNRTLPHFPVNSLTPAAKGFVANSFFSGLTATEFFFHTMGGREGLVDTAVKTAETGYMARRLMKALEDLSLQYDNTVRNSEQTVVQFLYGDDSLDPQLMERGDRPVDYHRLSVNVSGQHVDRQLTLPNDEETLLSHEVLDIVSRTMQTSAWRQLLPQGRMFLDETMAFFTAKADKLRQLEPAEDEGGLRVFDIRQRLQRMTSSERIAFVDSATSPDDHALSKVSSSTAITTARDGKKINVKEEKTKTNDNNTITSAAAVRDQLNALLRDRCFRLTRTQLERVLTLALRKYQLSQIQPGEAVGAVGAQSLSEPGTQMTLKTFHFAGVASMNVTLGVPRLKEIINASSAISTPIIEARLYRPDSLQSARIAKASIEKTVLSEVCHYIKEVYCKAGCYIAIRLDLALIQTMHLNISAVTVRDSILNPSNPGVKPGILRALKPHNVQLGDRSDKIRIFPPDMVKSRSSVSKKDESELPSSQRIYFILQALKAVLPTIIVQGIPSVSRAVINEESAPAGSGMTNGKKNVHYHLLVEGYGLQEVMTVPQIDYRSTTTNHIIEMCRVLGIEAARTKIAQEIKFIMSAYGISVDRRHLMLLSDVMTFKGDVLGITRFGVAKMKESVLMLASFEKTTDHLFDAAVHAREDRINGVSECIIMGVPVPVGTGIMKLVQRHPIGQDPQHQGGVKGEPGTTHHRQTSFDSSVPNRYHQVHFLERKKRLLESLGNVDLTVDPLSL